MSSPSPNASGSSRQHLHGLNILQTNMRHCTTGYLLLTQLLNERHFDIILIQDPPPQLTNQHKCPPGFRVLKLALNSPPSALATEDPLSLILIKNNIPVRSFPLPSNRFCGAFVSTRLGTLGLVSAYLPLHASVELSHLSTVLDTMRHTTPLYLIGGDFNGHSRWWGPPSQHTNSNGALIEDFILDNQLIVQNRWPSPATYTSDSGFQTWIDITLTSPRLTSFLHSWEALPETLLGSDHTPISFTVNLPCSPLSHLSRDWKSVHWDAFNATLKSTLECNMPPATTLLHPPAIDSYTQALLDSFQQTMSVHVPFKHTTTYSNHWWSPELHRLRSEAIRL